MEFRGSRLYFGPRFWWALLIAGVCIVLSIVVSPDTPLGRAVFAIVGLLGVGVGILLQPSPKPVDHQPLARQALQNLSTSNELIEDVKTVANQISDQDDVIRMRIGLANIFQDLTRAQKGLLSSMSAWDEISPDAVKNFKKAQDRGHEILRELSQQEGEDHE